MGRNSNSNAEVNVESLQEELRSLMEALAAERTKVQSLERSLETANNDLRIQVEGRQIDVNRITDLENKVSELESENETLTKVNEELTLKIEELSNSGNGDQLGSLQEAVTKISESKPLKIPHDSFTVGEKKYVFVSPVFMHKKTRVLAEEAILDENLLSEIVKAGLGVIREV